MSGWAILAALLWMLAGAGTALACVALRGRRLWKDADGIAYGGWLGRECEVDFGREWRRYTVVAVSWKGAVAVRPVDGGRTRWVPKDCVPERVRWL